MAWLVFSYSLPSQSSSSPRVTVWRRLKQIGAVAVAGGAQVLPVRDECAEAFQWLAQEIREVNGEAVVMTVDRFEGLAEAQLVDLFHAARAADYAELEDDLQRLEQAASAEDRFRLPEALERLRKRFNAIARIDYFDSPDGIRMAARLARLQQSLTPPTPGRTVASAAIDDYAGKRWVTRPRPHVDRLACAWLIRRFIDPQAPIRYSLQPEPDEIRFDMEPAEFGHQGSRCSFETMLHAFGLDDAGLRALAEIVHDIDLHEAHYGRPETEGLTAVLQGWRLAGLEDEELEARGLHLYEGLYLGLLGKPARRPRRAKKTR